MLPKLAFKGFKRLCNQSILQAFFLKKNIFYQELEIQKQRRHGLLYYVIIPVGGGGGKMSRSDDRYII